MASTFLGLNTAYTGLQAYQAAINTTAHNISNADTKGYSRQQTDKTADLAIRTYSSYGTLGTGVVVNSIEQIRDTYYDIKYRNNQTNVGQYKVYENYMNQIEDYLDDYSLQGMTTEWNNFFAALTELQKNPSDATTKNNVINSGMSMAQYFNNLTVNLRNVQIDANEEIKNQCDRINTLAENIAELNKQINMIEVQFGNANDLRDKRNQLVDELSQIINIETDEQQMGQGVTYFTVRANGQDLVSKYDYITLKTEAKTDKRNASDADGMYELTWSNGVTFNEYSDTLKGSLKALLDIRDGCNNAYEIETIVTDEHGNTVLDENGDPVRELSIGQMRGANTDYKGVPYYQSKLNEFIRLFSDAVNGIFTQTDENGVAIATNEKGEPGVPFFTVQYQGGAMSALTVEVNPLLIQDNNRLATTSNYLDGEAKSDIVDQLLSLQSERCFNGGTGSYFLESIVAAVAIDSKKATTFQQNFTNIANTIQNQRLSIMGVDEDEEGLDLLKAQQGYNLCSKVMSVLSEVYSKLINETGV